MSELSIPPAAAGTLGVRILRVSQGAGDTAARRSDDQDRVVVEAPLEFQLHHPSLGGEAASFGATMRTPGEDELLAAGLLYGEGIITRAEDIDAIETSTRQPNVVHVRLRAHVEIAVQTPARRFSAGSSCGVCGTTGLDAAIARAALTRVASEFRVPLAVLLGLPARMRAAQTKFGDTGGIHAAAAFDRNGDLQGLAEDVGRHNAFDKLIGEQLLANRLPLSERVVLLSGRASFELVQKALRAGVSVLASIGAPSSLAVNLAATTGLTLIGFLRETHCNVYTQPLRVG
jgi:FdhD protein